MADLTRIEGLLEDIYLVLRDSGGATGSATGGGTSGGGTSVGGSGSTGSGSPRNVRTGIYEIDRHIDALKRNRTSIDEFGKVLQSSGNRFLGGIGNFLTKYSANLAGAINVVKAAFDLWKGIIDVKNVKSSAAAQAARRNIQENELQFQRDTTLHTLDTEQITNSINYVGDVALKSLETSGAVMLQSLKIIADNQVKATEIAVGPLLDGINETAYKAAEYEIERKKDLKLLDAESNKSIKQLDLYTNLKDKQFQMQTEQILKQRESAEANYESASSKNAWQKAVEVREAEAEVALKELTYKTLVGAGGGAGVGAAVTSGTGPGAVIGGAIGAAGGGIWGAYKGITDKTGHESYYTGEQATSNMTNVFNRSGKYNREFVNYENDSHLLGKWERRLFKDFTSNRGEKMMEVSVDKFASEVKMVAEGNKTLIENSNKVQNAILEKQTALQEKSVDLQTEALKVQIEQETNQQKVWLKLAQETEKWLDNFDKITNNLGKSLGYTNRRQLENFQKNSFIVSQVASKFGKNYEEALKMQQSFIETTGRNRMFGEHDYGQLMGLSEYLGGDTSLAANYASEMEIFNAGVSDSVDMLDEALQDVNRIGLNGRKYTKTLVDNLKLAQKYQFKEGTKSLMNMAKWAENTRFNLASLNGMLDKVQEGGLENVITMGAQFQVLGGHAAMNADPIAMMYEAFADPEAYAKRMQDMTKGYGQVDKKTGETKFSVNEMMMMRQLAKIQGRSVEEVENEARARNKKEIVAKQLRGNFNEEQQALISNNATYNKQTGQFQVKVKDENGNYVERNVNELTTEDIEKLMPEKHNERMEDYMQTVVDRLGELTGQTELQKSLVAQENWDNRTQNYKERLEIANKSFTEHFEEYVKNSQEYSNFITQSYKDFVQRYNDGSDATEESIKKLNQMTDNIANALGETADVIRNANEFIKTGKEGVKERPNITQSQAEFDAKMVLDDYANHTIGHTQKDLDKIMKKIIEKYDSGVTDYNEYKGLLSSGWNDLLDSFDEITGRGDDVHNYSFKDVEEIVKAYKQNSSIGVRDGIISGNNKPIVSSASNVTKINDGLVQSDPKDVAIFAKEGGVIGNFLNDLYNDVHSANSGTISLDTVNVTISGSLDLSSGGQSVNIINELQTNPMLLRSLSRMLAQQISSAMNGGRGTSSMGIGSV